MSGGWSGVASNEGAGEVETEGSIVKAKRGEGWEFEGSCSTCRDDDP